MRERERRDCVERGYVLMAALLEQVFGGDHEAAHATAVEIGEIGERFGDQDLVALGLMEQGHALARQGLTGDGLRLVDETMVAVATGELSPIVAGIVYCNTIAFCQSVYELRRAREWTAALTRWCEQQPNMVAHNGLCLVSCIAPNSRRSGVSRRTRWQNSAGSASASRRECNQRALGHAAYGEGELHRLQGELEATEAAYRKASRFGREPQPGLALLRLAGNAEAAAAAIRRALSETIQPLKRAALLPVPGDHAGRRRRRRSAHCLP